MPLPHVDASRVLSARLDGEAVLLDLESKRYFRLNETGAAVWTALEDGLEMDAVVQRLCDEFDVRADEARAAVEGLISELQSCGLLGV